MSLENLYNSAAAGTNAGQAKNIGSAASPSTNFFDGTGRAKENAAPDEYQDGFKAAAPGSFRYGAGGVLPGTYDASAWKDKAVKNVDELLSKNNLTTLVAGDVRNAPNTVVHKFTPASAYKDSLGEFAKTKAQ